jgi:hypothetical protein
MKTCFTEQLLSRIDSTAFNSSGSLGSSSFILWGNSVAAAVFTNPVIAQARKTMNAVTACMRQALPEARR